MNASEPATDGATTWPERWPVLGPVIGAILGTAAIAFALSEGDWVAGIVFAAFAGTMSVVGRKNYQRAWRDIPDQH